MYKTDMIEIKKNLISILMLMAAGSILSSSSFDYQNSPFPPQTNTVISQSFSLENDGYLMSNGNNITTMNSSSFDIAEANSTIKNYQAVKQLINDLVLDKEDELAMNKFNTLIESLRSNDSTSNISISDKYVELINYIQYNDIYLTELLLEFFERKEYDSIFGEEDNFVVTALENGSIRIQELAINTLYSWRHSRYVNRIKNVTVKNYYLQKDLEYIVSEME